MTILLFQLQRPGVGLQYILHIAVKCLRADPQPQGVAFRVAGAIWPGVDQVLISVSSLSAKARKAYRAAQKVDGRDVIIDQRAKATPWYVEADLNHYIEGRVPFRM